MYTISKIISLTYLLLKARNEGSVIGLFWYLLNPILTFSLLFLIFNQRLGASIENYALYLLLGIIIFNVFRNITSESSRIIEANKFLFLNTTLKPWVVVMTTIAKFLVNHIFELVLFFAVYVYFGFNIFMLFLYIPILILLLIFSYGVSLFLIVCNAYISDTENLWGFFVQLLWFATPIFYAIGGQNKLQLLNYLNPLFYYIEISRQILIYSNYSEWILYIGVILSAVISFIIGTLIYTKYSSRMVEMV